MSKLAYVDKDGVLWANGFNYYNQLGYDVDDYTDDFIKITDNVKDIEISNYTIILLKNDGTLIGMGQNVFGEFALNG